MKTEKRLIDANALKERAIRVSTVKELGNKEHCYIKAVGTHEIDKAPTVDAVEVVRCKDCKYVRDHVGYIRCDHPDLDWDVECYDLWLMRTPNDFCSQGERRTDAK